MATAGTVVMLPWTRSTPAPDISVMLAGALVQIEAVPATGGRVVHVVGVLAVERVAHAEAGVAHRVERAVHRHERRGDLRARGLADEAHGVGLPDADPGRLRQHHAVVGVRHAQFRAQEVHRRARHAAGAPALLHPVVEARLGHEDLQQARPEDGGQHRPDEQLDQRDTPAIGPAHDQVPPKSSAPMLLARSMMTVSGVVRPGGERPHDHPHLLLPGAHVRDRRAALVHPGRRRRGVAAGALRRGPPSAAP